MSIIPKKSTRVKILHMNIGDDLQRKISVVDETGELVRFDKLTGPTIRFKSYQVDEPFLTIPLHIDSDPRYCWVELADTDLKFINNLRFSIHFDILSGGDLICIGQIYRR